MNPKNTTAQDDNTSSEPRRVQVPHRSDTTMTVNARDRDAAAQLVRTQLDHIYDTTPPNQPKQQEQAQTGGTDNNPYNRTHTADSMQQASQSDAWKQYHSSWQKYYQEYYQRYYLQQLQAQKEELSRGAAERAKVPAQDTTPSNKPEPSSKEESKHTARRSSSENPATRLLQHEIVQKIKQQAEGVRHSAHFMPIISAIVVGLMFMFVQYNRMFVASVKAYVSPGSTASQNIILDPTTNTKVTQDPRIIIPKINVDAPVVNGLSSIAEADVQRALQDGVVHYPIPGANSLPGQKGNSVFLGHSSNDVFDNGNYKFVFLLLERLEVGDTFYVHYQGTRYTYSITKKEVILPNEVGKLVLPADKPMATLVTCVPIGTALKRLVVYAEQISPSPTSATGAPEEKANEDAGKLPGYSPTFLDRLFGGN
ncbi:hypothetical protein CYG49_02175 [Candidatus Saccharibacteria bacterium]|nr:MAG: hypothetical protein CYG49_02175 [Candidatus Saccharibacteria bacterium]